MSLAHFLAPPSRHDRSGPANRPRTLLASTLRRLASVPAGGPRHATNIAFDTVNFGQRDSFAQAHVRQEMYRILKKAFAESGVTWPEPTDGWAGDRGDGVLIVLASTIPSQHDIDLLIFCLAAELRRHNRAASMDTQIKLRMAINAGQVRPDDAGLGGKVIVTLFRLLDAGAFKEAIAAVDATLGVIVSQEFYAEEIEPGWGLLDPKLYKPVTAVSKETIADAWLTIL